MPVFYDKVEKNPVVAAVKRPGGLENALRSPCEIVFLLSGSIFTLGADVERIKETGKEAYIHFDLIDGFSRDAIALEYIRKQIQPHGILTTKSGLIHIAQELGLFAIQRFFLIDSLSMESAVKVAETVRPDAIEVMPGLIPRIIRSIHEAVEVPIIAGGLIQSKEDVLSCLSAGAVGISTSLERLWYI